MRPVCVRCRCEMQCEKNDVWVLAQGEMWSGDLWRCPGCRHEIVTGFGKIPVASEGDDAFEPQFRAASERGELYAVSQ